MAEGIVRQVAIYVTGDGDVVEFYDREEIYENCTVQVLINTISGRSSVGWRQNPKEEKNGVD